MPEGAVAMRGERGRRQAHPAILRLPAIEGLLADPVPAADLRRRRPALLLRNTLMICGSLNPLFLTVRLL